MSLHICTSVVGDGSMKSTDQNFASVLPLRRKFLRKNSIPPSATTLVQVTYESNDFCRYRTLPDTHKGDGIVRTPSLEADALVVTEPNHALFLPLADCIGAVIHDSNKNILMVSHLGRHNLLQFGGTKCIDYLINKHDVDPKSLTVWLSPAAGENTYPLHDFNGRSMHDVAFEQLIKAKVTPEHITISPVDVTTNTSYFSHSQFLKGKRETDGRFAVVALLS